MRIQVDLSKIQESKKKYPCTMILPDINLIVLFKEKKCGTVLFTGTTNGWCIGDYSEDWNEKQFKKLPIPITLSND